MEKSSYWIVYGSSLIAVFGTIAGVFITQFFTCRNKRAEYREKRQEDIVKCSREFKKQYIIEPVLNFLELDLKMAQNVYANALHGIEDKIECGHQANIVMLSVKIGSLDKSLYDKFVKYNSERVILNTKALSEKDINGAYESLEKAKSLAIGIIKSLNEYYSGYEFDK